jgi:DNA invertase Pin-like site-specific DNA recombinase
MVGEKLLPDNRLLYFGDASRAGAAAPTGASIKADVNAKARIRSASTENQQRELEAVAARSGWQVVDFYEDAGISGAKGRDKRPGFDRLLKDAIARKINMIAAWSVDRLGRSLQDLVVFLTEL